MNKRKFSFDNIGCFQGILILIVGMFILSIFFGAVDGITRALDKIPWYAHALIVIAIIVLVSSFNKGKKKDE